MGADRTLTEALPYGVEQVRAVIPTAVTIGLYLPNREGRLRLARRDGEESAFLDKQRAALRHSVLETASAARLNLEHPPDSAWLGIPLARGGRAFGVLTVIAPRRTLQRKRHILDVIAAQAGALLAASASAREQHEQLGLQLACTAHELRNPVAAAQVAIAYALQQGVAHPDSSELLRHSQQELEQLSTLVDGLLRWGAGDVHLETGAVDLLDVTRDAVASCTWELGRDGVRISAPERDRVAVRGDRAQLKTAIANIVRNAMAHAPPGTDIEVGIYADDGGVRVSVEDAGPGVADDDRDAIFEPFVLGRDGPRADGNRGLGLFIARRIVEAHGGAIRVGSGPGATFVIELPLARVLRDRAS